MVFSSLLFLFRFLPIVLLIYYVAPKKARNLVLFLSSLVFYAWGEPVYVFLMIGSTTVDYIVGRWISACREKKRDKEAVIALLVSVLTNLAVLGFFKYADFVLRVIGSITGLSMPTLDLALPIGISFYTFQTMSYTIDVYRGQTTVQKNFISFGAYVAMFPQLVAGPIVRYQTVADQLKNRRESISMFYQGCVRFAVGLGKKVLLANSVGQLFEEVAAANGSELTTMSAWLGLWAFTLQIYFDFSGYSDMAIGLGAMFGFSFPENFRYPYEAKSITEFWRRWHISLGSWFREYVYIPLGGNRKGIWRQLLNILIVWMLTGLWHGAYVNFIVWGMYYAVLLILEKTVLRRVLDRFPDWLKQVYTMVLVMLGWGIFAWQDMRDAAGFFGALIGRSEAGFVDAKGMYLLLSYGVLCLFGSVGARSVVKRTVTQRLLPEHTLRRSVGTVVYIILIFVASVAMLVNTSYNPFLYFRF